MAKTDSPGGMKLDAIGHVGPAAYVLWSDVVGINGHSHYVSAGSDLHHYTEVLLRGGGSVCTKEHDNKDARDRELEKLLAEWRRHLPNPA